MPPASQAASVASRLYRLLLRARRDFQHARVPLVGVPGVPAPPALDVAPQLAAAFRAARGAAPGDAARLGSDGFRVLRQAKQQLSVLQGVEDETREALRSWSQLCNSWARRLPAAQQPTHAQHPLRAAAAASAAATSSVSSGTAPFAASAADATEEAGGATSAGHLQLLAAALEEGALLAERLYEATRPIGLEDDDDGTYDEDADAERGAGAAGADATPGGGSISTADRVTETETVADAVVALPPHAPGVRPAHAVHDGGSASAIVRDDLPSALHSGRVAAVRQQLDELAAAVAAAHPGLFLGHCSASSSSSSSRGSEHIVTRGDGGGAVAAAAGQGARDTLWRQLEAISQELFRERKFKHEPVEWVYDGLAPALLPYVLRRRRGIPLSLAVLYCCVARRLGVAAYPILAAGGAPPPVAEGPAALHSLPPDVAARQGARGVALAPPLDAWLVAAPLPRTPEEATSRPPSPVAVEPGQAGRGEALLLVDVDRRGRVMAEHEARQRYRDLPPAPLAAALRGAPVAQWAELARVAATAHTRRGESDAVAHWLVQVLALDPAAPEWQVMLRPA